MTATPSARTDSPTARLIDDALEMSPKTLREIAQEIGFSRGNVLSMMRSGEMRLPIERAPALARALGIDQHLLIKTAMNEYMPEIWAVLAGAGPAFPNLRLNIEGPAPVIERFQSLAQGERRTYADMLSRLMARYDPGCGDHCRATRCHDRVECALSRVDRRSNLDRRKENASAQTARGTIPEREFASVIFDNGLRNCQSETVPFLWCHGLCCTYRLMAKVPLTPDRLIPQSP